MRKTLLFPLILSCTLLNSCEAQLRAPQVDLSKYDTVGYDFLIRNETQLENAAHLDKFFEKLYYQRVAGGRRVSIVHIGDSHILGNYLTREVRVRLQRSFGDAGRGFIFPYKLAGTNGPRDYLVESTVRWQSGNCNQNLAASTPYGLSGFSLETATPKGELTVRLRDTVTAETSLLTKVTIFQHTAEAQYPFTIVDPVTHQEAMLLIQGDRFKSYYFSRPVGQFTLQFAKSAPEQKRLCIDGIAIENELAGIAYHSIGVNGAKFSDFSRAKHFAKQIGDLAPDLAILSFGTNEGQFPVQEAALYKQIHELVAKIQEDAPGCAILLTTPADSYLRGKGFNPHLAAVATTIRRYAHQHHVAIWDLYRLGGGEESAQAWKSAGLMSSDSVHYSKAGYATQGKLLYQSIIKSYNDFIQPVLSAKK